MTYETNSPKFQVVIEPELDIMSLRGILKPIPGVDITHIENDSEGPDWPGGCDSFRLLNGSFTKYAAGCCKSEHRVQQTKCSDP